MLVSDQFNKLIANFFESGSADRRRIQHMHYFCLRITKMGYMFNFISDKLHVNFTQQTSYKSIEFRRRKRGIIGVNKIKDEKLQFLKKQLEETKNIKFKKGEQLFLIN